MDRASFEQLLLRRTNRRRFLAGTSALVTMTSLRGRPTRIVAKAVAPFTNAYPFALGVASGDPLPDGVVLWARLAPDPLNGGGMPPEPVEVRWEIARDESFDAMVQQGSATATPEFGHSVHVDVTGLDPGREYFYRFLANGEISPTGRTKTAPAAGTLSDRLRFGFASCAHWEHGYFAAYRHLAREDLDLILFQGDYIYEYGPNNDYQSGGGTEPVRLFAGSDVITTLEDYRVRHAQYKTDPDLQEAHQLFPWVATWDDHEVANDYAGILPVQGDPTDNFLARRAVAYQAYYEHMPLRPESMPQGSDLRLYRRLTFGTLAELAVLDTRQYRTDQSCGNTVGPRCDAALDPAATMTGPEQERWLLERLGTSQARWKIISQQTMMAELAVKVLGPDTLFNDDQWDGYPLARNRILGHIRDAEIANAVVLSGDVHSAWVNDLKADFADPASPTVATEFVCSSVTAINPIGGRLALLLATNPHIKFLDLRHGYTVCDVTPSRWQTDYRAVKDVTKADAPVETIGSFVVEDGTPGAVKA
ncbi:MAG: alkaline phosphatase [Thermomicrobiales bacterium]|nr:alkaline phosphatase [Thermomicrobiales bacterium]